MQKECCEQMCLFASALPNTLSGVHIAITGTLPVTRAAMISGIEACGGVYDPTVKLVTDYLIVGVLRPTMAMPDGISRKLRRAEQLRAAGGHICIVSQEDFLRLLEGEKT